MKKETVSQGGKGKKESAGEGDRTIAIKGKREEGVAPFGV